MKASVMFWSQSREIEFVLNDTGYTSGIHVTVDIKNEFSIGPAYARQLGKLLIQAADEVDRIGKERRKDERRRQNVAKL